MLIHGTTFLPLYWIVLLKWLYDFVLDGNNFIDELSYSYAARDSPKYEPYQRYFYCSFIFTQVYVVHWWNLRHIILCMYIYSIYVFIYFGSFIFSEGLHHQDPALVPRRNPRKQKWSLLRVLVEKVMKRAWSRVLPFLHN